MPRRRRGEYIGIMTDTFLPNSDEPHPPASREFQEVLRVMGQALNSATLYGAGHKITQMALDDCHRRLTALLATRESLSFAMVEGALLVEDHTVDTRNALVAAVVKRLAALEVDTFDLVKGLSREEVGWLVGILSAPPERVRAEGTFADALAKNGLLHARASVSSFQKITDADLVLKKDNIIQELAGAAASLTGEPPKGLEQIVAFLKGEVGAGNGSATGGAAEPPPPTPETDAARLTDLIMKAAEVRESAVAVDGGESLTELVVGSLRRHTAELMQSPAARTKQGRKTIAKTLMLLEQNVLERLRAAAGADVDTAAVEELFDDLRSDLEVDSLAADYIKKRSALESSEGKVRRYLKRNAKNNPDAAAALEERLLEEGLTPDGWKELRIVAETEKRGASVPAAGKGGSEKGGSGGAAGGGMEGMQALFLLLNRLDSLLVPPGAPTETDPAAREDRRKKVAEVTDMIQRQINDAATAAENQINAFGEVVASMATAAEKEERRQEHDMSRHRLLQVLAEIIQELFQPLSVISSTLEMMLTRRLGEINEDQESMLRLSSSSSERLTHLSEKLRSLCGNPETRIPDAEILGMVYNQPEKQTML